MHIGDQRSVLRRSDSVKTTTKGKEGYQKKLGHRRLGMA